MGYQYFCDTSCPLSNSNGYVYYHRYVASNKIGRWLTSDEHVHHIDGNKTNNDPNNLMIVDKHEHPSIESYRIFGNIEMLHCIICGNIINIKSENFLCVQCFMKTNPEISGEYKDYYFGKRCDICNRLISNENSVGICDVCCRKAKRLFDPNKEELELLVWQFPTTKVAEMFGVSDKAIDKRCKILGISKPGRGYWRKKETGKL
jgi:hypothetical protein